MNIENLRAFYKTVYHKNISLAAKELYLSQPAISQQIKALEKDLKVILLMRSNKGVITTPPGELVYQYAERILNLYDNMIKDLECFENDCTNRLTISSCLNVGQYALPCLIHEFNRRHENVIVNVDYNLTAEVIYNIKEKGIDIGFIEGCYTDDDISCIPLGEFKMYFVANGNWKEKSLSKNKLFRYNFFMLDKKCTLRKIIEKTLIDNGIEIKKLKFELETPSIESLKSAVAAGYGLSILPYIAIKKELYTKILSIVQVEDIEFKYIYSIIYNKKIYKKSKSDFIDFIKTSGKNFFC
ncbi:MULTISPECIES: LysR substrate-binding domain-containing protein [Thermoanaerobacterium]|uniref:Transcriptional regulator, LysR family n=1 Tax=Thermoanaerobacterium xylanolyticum (strain ATCC 49914 / DSM 7097 / LX-11) TaxID=858215 RepID=F6BJF7_THEXL|nr:LysR substrate-binding domain-containing protein [Thermoanaerobacterium xylanolyticum]AEF16925.1 transcriptional regulator, LysR family [Thermoanaerobacterium xylanolyticum LX-11]